MLTAKVRKLGNSKVVVIKSSLLKRLGMRVGDKINLICNGRSLRFRKNEAGKHKIAKLAPSCGLIIPKIYADDLDIDAGDRLEVTELNGTVRLKKVLDDDEKLGETKRVND